MNRQRRCAIVVVVGCVCCGWGAEQRPTVKMDSGEYVAFRFEPREGWGMRVNGGNGGASKLDARNLTFDFTQGAAAVGIAPPDESLLGTPREIRIRVLGKAPGHPVRLRIATHFMTFERTIGQFDRDGEYELVTPAPPGEGWKWFGGENDGKIHGPLRITGIYLDKGDRADAGQIELVDIRVKGDYKADQAYVLMAELRGSAFVTSVQTQLNKPLVGSLTWALRDWAGNTISTSKVEIPPASPAEQSIPIPPGEHRFIEAEATIQIEGQKIPSAFAYHVAPIEPQDDARLDPASPFGMGIYLNRYSSDPEGLKTMDRAARLAREAGVKWSREDFGWGRIEPRKGEFDWRYYDALVATAKRNGISIYGLLGYWSSWTKPYTPEGIEDYCRFAAATVEHYKNDIHHWEIWNEPNIFFWQGPRDMYAELLSKAYAAIKKADPTAQVLGCSTAGIDSGFIKRTMELGAPFDILTIHPYRRTLDDRGFIKELQAVVDLVKRPDGTPREVWITEMGWATYVPHNTLRQDFEPFTPRQQAQLLARSYIDAMASGGRQNISWYNFRCDGTDPMNFEHNMGIVTRDFRIKPAYRAFATVTRMLKAKRIDKPLDLGDDVTAFRFTNRTGGGGVIAMWSLKSPQTVSLPAQGPATLTDLMGTAQPLNPADGKLLIPLQPGVPVFVTVAR